MNKQEMKELEERMRVDERLMMDEVISHYLWTYLLIEYGEDVCIECSYCKHDNVCVGMVLECGYTLCELWLMDELDCEDIDGEHLTEHAKYWWAEVVTRATLRLIGFGIAEQEMG